VFPASYVLRFILPCPDRAAFLIPARVFRYNKADVNRSGSAVDSNHRLYLRLGDKVIHTNYGEWGSGVVVEVMTSVLVGGTCLVRILFEDGQQRTFNNDLDSDICCYYFGLRRSQHPLFANQRPRVQRPTKRITRE
jgi:hypothetical protein